MTTDAPSASTRPPPSSAPRIVRLLALLSLPFLVLAGVSVWRETRAQERRVTAERLALARSAASTADAFIAGNLSTVRSIANAPFLPASEGSSVVRAFLELTLTGNTDWEGIGVANPDGVVIQNPRLPPRTFNASDRPYFRQLQQRGQPVVSEALINRASGIAAIVVAAPVDFGLEKPGAVIVTLSTERLAAQLRSLGQSDELRVIVVDASGQTFVHPNRDTVLSLTRVDDRPEVQAALAGATGSVRVRDADGRNMLASYAPVPQTGWAVLVEQPTADAFGAAQRSLRMQLSLLLVAAVATTGLAIYLGSKLNRFYEGELAARRQAEAALRSRDEFLSSASHDLRSPLATIKATAQVLHRRITRAGEVDRQIVVENLERIDAVATRMTAQINELLDVARLQLHRSLSLQRQPVDLVALARRVAADHQQTTSLHSIIVETTEASLIGDWDEARLERVISNLLVNSIKYSPDGGQIALSLQSEQGAGGTWAVLCVRDSGLGIPAVDLPHIFDRFHRASNVVGRISGTGIGLAGALQIVQEHGGSIDVESVEGHGTTFTIRLPLSAPGAGAQGSDL